MKIVCFLQSRLQRCAIDCRDKATDTLGANATEAQKQQATVTMERCVVKCVDTHLELLPAFLKRIKQTINDQNK